MRARITSSIFFVFALYGLTACNRLLGVSVRTLQEWEQGRRAPSGPARMLLAIAHKNPKVLLEAV